MFAHQAMPELGTWMLGTSLGLLPRLGAAAGSQAFSGRDVPGGGCWGEASFLLPVHLLPIRALPLQTQGIFLDRADTVTAWETA